MVRVVIILGLIALVLVAPFVIRGYSGDDYEFHLTSWMEMRNAWSNGVFEPGWAAVANFGLGEPRFCFYPPVSIWIGAALSFLLPWRIVPGAFVWLMIFLGGLCMYAASGQFVNKADRLRASVLYSASPYLLMTAIHRFAAAELCVLAFLPLLVKAYFRTIWCMDRSALLSLALFFALTESTNVPSAIVFIYMMFLGCLIATAINRSWVPFLYYLAAGTVSLVISAFSLLPAVVEQRWISVNNLYLSDYHQFFLFASLSTQANPSFRIALWVITFASVGIAIMCALSGRDDLQRPDWMLFTFIGATFALQLPITSPLWDHLPELKLVQFPFRFLSLCGVCVPLILLSKRTKRNLRGPGYLVIAVTALLAYGGSLRHVLRIDQHAPSDFAAYFASLRSGYPGRPEYVPEGETWSFHPVKPAPLDTAAAFSGSNCRVTSLSRDSLHQEVSVTGDATCQVHLDRYYYPFWRATDRTGASLTVGKDSQGLLLIYVPPGKHDVRVRFDATSPLRITAAAISMTTVFLVLVILLRSYAAKRHARRSGESGPVCVE